MSPATRLAAWIVTGPPGHFASAMLDFWTLGRYLSAQRAARREQRRAGTPDGS